ncbi:hypothetical protein SNEBB_009414 [Seison nebaliae]|nr:hypothetical protein SNEBB_009414 [Seison nebaliae]
MRKIKRLVNPRPRIGLGILEEPLETSLDTGAVGRRSLVYLERPWALELSDVALHLFHDRPWTLRLSDDSKRDTVKSSWQVVERSKHQGVTSIRISISEVCQI